MQELLQRPTGLDQLLGPTGEGLMGLAAMVDNADIVALLLNNLLRAGDEKGLPSWIGQTVGDAARWGNNNFVMLLINSGADVNAALSWKEGRTPLPVAAERGHLPVMEMLIPAGAEIDANDENRPTALSWATYSQDVTAIGRLIQERAMVDAADNQGRTPLSWAA